MARQASVSVSITADIEQYRKQIAGIDDATGDAAAKAAAQLEAKIGKRLAAVAAEAKAAARQIDGVGDGVRGEALDAGKAIQGVEGIGRVFGGTIGEVTGALGDFEAVFSALPAAAGVAGLALGGVAAAALYFYNQAQEARKEAEEFAKNLESIAENAGPLTSRVLEENADLVERLAQSEKQAADATQALAARQALDLAPSLIDANNALIEQELLAARAAGSLEDFSDEEIRRITRAAEDAVAEYNAFSDVTIKAREGVLVYDQAWAAAARKIRDARDAQADLNEEIGKNSVLIDGWIEGADSVLQTEAERQAAAEAAAAAERRRDEQRRAAEAAAERRRRAAEAARAERAKAAAEALRAEQAAWDSFTKSLDAGIAASIEYFQREAATLAELEAARDEALASTMSETEALGAQYDERIKAVRALAAEVADSVAVQDAAVSAELAIRDQYFRDLDALRQRDAAAAEATRQEEFAAVVASATAEREAVAAAFEAARVARLEAFDQTAGLLVDLSGFAQQLAANVIDTYDTQTKVGRAAALQAFKVSKGFALTDVAIKTAQAIVGYLAATPPNPIGAASAAIVGATQAAAVAAQRPSFHAGRFGGAMAGDEMPATIRRGEVVVPSPLVASAGGPEAVRDRLEGPAASAPVQLIADFGDRRVIVPLGRAARRGGRNAFVGWSRSNGF